MSRSYTLGKIIVQNGEKKAGFLKIAQGPLDPIGFPFTLIKGVKEGLTLLVTSGIHPCEFAGVVAVTRLCDIFFTR